jgi:hypothetical protein
MCGVIATATKGQHPSRAAILIRVWTLQLMLDVARHSENGISDSEPPADSPVFKFFGSRGDSATGQAPTEAVFQSEIPVSRFGRIGKRGIPGRGRGGARTRAVSRFGQKGGWRGGGGGG